MKTLLIISLMMVMGLTLQAQDKIFKKDGTKINCKITAIDDSRIYFAFENNSKTINTYILKENVVKYRKDKIMVEVKNEAPVEVPAIVKPVEITPEELVEEPEL
jgi:hypothetical protein